MTTLREAQWADKQKQPTHDKGFDTSECRHDFGCWGSKFRVCETGTDYIRYCKVCGLEVERIEKGA